MICNEDNPDDTHTYYDPVAVIHGLFNKYLQPMVWMSQHQISSAVLQLRGSYLRMHRYVQQQLSEQQLTWQHTNALVAYQLNLWQRVKLRLDLLESVLFDFALLPLILDVEVKYQQGEHHLEENKLVERSDATLKFTDAKTKCTDIILCDQPTMFKFIQTVSQIISMETSIHCQNHIQSSECSWVSQSVLYRKMATETWIKSFPSVIDQIMAIYMNLDIFNEANIRRTAELPILISDCQACLLHDIYTHVQYLCHNSMDNTRYSSVYASSLGKLSRLHKLVLRKQLSPSTSIEVLYTIAKESINFAYQAIAMKNYLLGFVCDRYSQQCYLHQELGTALVAVAEAGLRTCLTFPIEPLVETHSIRFQTCQELYAIAKRVYQEALLMLNFTERRESNRHVRRHSLYTVSFKPLLQLYFSPESKTAPQLKDTLIFSLGELIHSFRDMDITATEEQLSLTKTLHKVITHSFMTANMKTNTMVATALLMLDLLKNMIFKCHLGINSLGPDLQKIITVCNRWWEIQTNQTDGISSVLLQQLVKIQLLIEITNQKELRTLPSLSSASTVSMLHQSFTRDEIHHIVKAIPCDKIDHKLEAMASLLTGMETTEDVGLQETNMELLATYLFWVEKTLEVQIMQYEITTCIEGRLEEPVNFGDEVLTTLLSPLRWIEEIGATASTTYSIFQHKLIDEEITEEQASTWLLSKSIFQIPAAWGQEEQERATQCMIEAASKWQAEYKSVVNEGVEKALKTEVSQQSLPYIFQLFCEN
jgi:hypothetical protein